MPEIIFDNVPPLFQEAHKKFFEGWAYDYRAYGGTRVLGVQLLPPMAQYHPKNVATATVTCITFCGDMQIRPMPVGEQFIVTPSSPADLDAVVTWERKMFAKQFEPGHVMQWGHKLLRSFTDQSQLAPYLPGNTR